MKTVRLFYKKEGRAIYVSHLDTMRAMTRLLRRAGLPVWSTEGFNPHLYITFAMPLSLGFKSDYEIADIRLTDDDFPLEGICERLNESAPDGFCFFAAKEPVKKLPELAFAAFRAEFEDGGAFAKPLEDFLGAGEITVSKKTKRGDIKTFNAAPDIKDWRVEKGENTTLYITLPAGPQKSINPDLLIGKFLEENGECYMRITRTMLFDQNLEPLQ
ncbi:MAG: TIGR03936 family radical SAM-associated protein [Clostridia bacterium]|nr:TIGR03936 family radical SAM-associated protein [Clostridia bacterium]